MNTMPEISLIQCSPPIVIIHNGYSKCARLCVNQASYNYDGPIVLVGNGTEGSEGNFSSINTNRFNSAADNFRKIYRHISVNSPAYECFCFERWFILRELMLASRLDRVVAMDSDVFIYPGVHETIGRLRSYRFSSWTHFAVLELSALVEFCDFLTGIYSKSDRLELFAEHRRVKKMLDKAHLSDMDFFEEFALTSNNSVNMNVAFMFLGVDPNISLSHGCKMKGDIKEIHWFQRRPMVLETSSGINYPLSILHLQGNSKIYADKLISYPQLSEPALLLQAMPNE